MAMVPASTYGGSPTLPSREAVAPPHPPGEVPKGTNLLGVVLGLVADAMVLAALLAAWWTIKSGSAAWPPHGVRLGTYLPTIVTITVAMSAVSMAWAVSSIRRNDQRSAGVALILTAFLGIAIANAQWYSLHRARLGIHHSAYATLFNLLMGYHLVHVAAGIGLLVVVGARVLAGHFGRENYDPVKALNAYWQYTNLAWGAIVVAVFLFSAHA